MNKRLRSLRNELWLNRWQKTKRFPYPQEFIEAGLNQETAIVLAGLYNFSSYKAFESLNEWHGIFFDYIGGITRWEDDSENYDGWRDPPFTGFRIVLWDSAFTPLQTKMFDSGEEALCYAYLTEKNAQEILKWVKYFKMDKRIVALIRREFGLSGD